MKYLKLFENTNAYEAWKNSDDYVLPNVSWCEDGGLVYDPIKVSIVYNMVDLGLPSGILWADRNIGATSPEEVGLYFQWADTTAYTEEQVISAKYNNWSSYFDIINPVSGEFKKYDSDKFTTLQPEDDAANIHMGSLWCMPSRDDFAELINNTTITYIDLQNNEYSKQDIENKMLMENSLKGVRFTGSNGNSIYIPVSVSNVGDGFYNRDIVNIWSNEFDYGYIPLYAYTMYLDESGTIFSYRGNVRCDLNPIRGIKKFKYTGYTNPNVNVVSVFNVTNISNETKIMDNYGLVMFKSMIVDGVEIDVDMYHQFNVVGEHTIEFVPMYDYLSEHALGFIKNIKLSIPEAITRLDVKSVYVQPGGTLIFTSKVCPTLYGDYSSIKYSLKNITIKYPKGADYSAMINLMEEYNCNNTFIEY